MTGLSAGTCRGHLQRHELRKSASHCIKLIRSVPKGTQIAYTCIQSRAASERGFAAHVKGCIAAGLAAAILLVGPATSTGAEVQTPSASQILRAFCGIRTMLYIMAVHMRSSCSRASLSLQDPTCGSTRRCQSGWVGIQLPPPEASWPGLSLQSDMLQASKYSNVPLSYDAIAARRHRKGRPSSLPSLR